jgi:hypothetical protein
MSDETPSPGVVQMLLAGPRGRRLLLEYALASELARSPVRDGSTFGQAVVVASSRIGPRMRDSSALFGEVDVVSKEKLPNVTPSEIAERLNAVELIEPTPELLRMALAAAVGHARYWQESDGEDILAAASEMNLALQRVAEHVAASPLTAWWVTPADTQTQQSVQWDDAPRRPVLSEGRRAHPTANRSGEWWSHPPQVVPASARSLFDDSPAGLWFVEDNLGWHRAESANLIVPEGMQVLEIEGASDWAQLCTHFPQDVTRQMHDDWYRATAHTARWLVPDWAQVAKYYDAVHLQVGAYLAAAGVAIPIDVNPKTASVIAGWNPDETYWFTPNIAYGTKRTHWKLEEHGTEMVWLPDQAEL